ncbi:hypothetical protein H5410_016682, partial [Solanum commersonii]
KEKKKNGGPEKVIFVKEGRLEMQLLVIKPDFSKILLARPPRLRFAVAVRVSVSRVIARSVQGGPNTTVIRKCLAVPDIFCSGRMRPIFCGNFEFETRQPELERLFKRYGKVDRVDMKSGKIVTHVNFLSVPLVLFLTLC